MGFALGSTFAKPFGSNVKQPDANGLSGLRSGDSTEKEDSNGAPVALKRAPAISLRSPHFTWSG